MEQEDLSSCFKLNRIIWSLLDCCVEIRNALMNTPIRKLTSHNKFGDQQLQLDIICDNLVEKHLRQSKEVTAIINEQRPQYLELGTGLIHKDNGDYVVTYDPLDGSSIIDTNFAMGTIIAIWKRDPNKLIGSKVGDLLVNALLVVYGPRTTCIYYNDIDKAVQELTLLHGKWKVTEKECRIDETTKIYSPGNLRAASQNKDYREEVVKLMDRGLTLRYTGGLVPDAHQIFIKGNGLFMNLSSKNFKVKLRVLYEIAATCFLVEKAGGKSIARGHPQSALDYVIQTYDDKIEFACGSAKEIEHIAYLFK